MLREVELLLPAERVMADQFPSTRRVVLDSVVVAFDLLVVEAIPPFRSLGV
jgi:hypothetical protein